ncbi:hypothetical protein EW146_g1976 [Bondarzewia mesenterica]|uniref:Glucose-methanol-choline oxidoreductase N-terminal domain-containing protein n=1 Tax=Bondarzewia mesenterica TaxID=1095465 RepID=A0A4S4M2M5_9AGAM|nr:hypothetical protein EW146_g1976 [Bondarzewia mesenterica]
MIIPHSTLHIKNNTEHAQLARVARYHEESRPALYNPLLPFEPRPHPFFKAAVATAPFPALVRNVSSGRLESVKSRGSGIRGRTVIDSGSPAYITCLLSALLRNSPSHHNTTVRYFPARRHFRARNIASADQIKDTYDFVIAGGGTAGLVLASRLSEDSNTTVLVLEAGQSGDDALSTIDIPGNTYYQSLLNTDYDWAYKTVAQQGTNNRVQTWPRGKVLGGSSAINGMYSVWPSQIEVDAWAGLMTSVDANAKSKWGWDAMFAAMKKSETFGVPSDTIKAEGNIEYDASTRGSSGPVHVSYPGYLDPLVGDWIPTLSALGVPESSNAYGGSNWGAFIATSTINPTNWTRSYSRSAYVDPLPPRSNLQILPNAFVTRILFSNSSSSNNLTASAVEYAANRTATLQSVNVHKEVVLAAGAIGSPAILMYSGVGPKDVLSAAGVGVKSALPGVGQHLQDHLSTQLTYTTTEETVGAMHSANNYSSVPGGPSVFLSFINSATAYVNITTLLGGSASAFQSNVTSALASSAASLVPSTDSTVIEGYKAIYNISAQDLLMSPLGHVEILLSLTTSSVGVQAALQRPFSQGYIYINSSDPFDAPVIDPRYLSHPADLTLIREGLKFARSVAQSAPLSQTLTGETSPGSSVSTDADWDTWLANAVGTEFHPSCSCAMLPLSQGGVVDTNLRVYGLANVRIADASVFPIQFAAHLQAPVYGLAEQASNIIRSFYNAAAPSNSSSFASASSSASGAKPSQTQQTTSGALRSHAGSAIGVLGGLLLAALALVV